MSEIAVLSLRGVGFTYRRKTAAALTDIDLEIEPGSLHAVLGPLESGTSTLARLVVGLLSDRGEMTGHLEVHGTAVMLGDDPEAQLSGMTSRVADEVQLPRRLHGADSATARSCAEAALRSLGIEDLWPRRLDTLSGGQRQLVALASLLTLGPELLVLDQPSLSLDPAARTRLADALSDYRERGGAVLITGHQSDELTAVCDELSLLDRGRLLRVSEQEQSWTPAATQRAASTAALTAGGVWATAYTETTELASDSDTTPEAENLRTDVPPLLVVDRLRVVRGESAVLDSIDLKLRRGESVTIMGPNGAGKSTLLRGLLGLLEPTAECTGTITVGHLGADLRIDGLPSHERAAHLGWVGQDPGIQLSARTVAAELTTAIPLPTHRRRDRESVRAKRQAQVDEAMAAVELTGLAEVHPFDLDIARRKDLVAATALLSGATILLLDEPTLGRDQRAIDRLNLFIADFLHRGGAVLSTTHDRRWAYENAHRVLHLQKGRLETIDASVE
ncbi:ATP-binding cassette domain-containing protein [Brevibacterium sp. GP-SGM9]|uniref:ATP-binding cassette domain-containing protein n=1 Tax=Brevibacterium sp. GP-SGM9 TaxID=3376990 RepID=UPI0039A5F945